MRDRLLSDWLIGSSMYLHAGLAVEMIGCIILAGVACTVVWMILRDILSVFDTELPPAEYHKHYYRGIDTSEHVRHDADHGDDFKAI